MKIFKLNSEKSVKTRTRALAMSGLLTLSAGFLSPALAVPVQGHAMVMAGPSPNAVEIAREVSLKGGNAVDVAVAVALSLAVTHPYFASFGGGGFVMVKMNGKVRALDFRETAPAKTDPNTFTNLNSHASMDGGLAVGVPGIPAGLYELHQTYGKLKWHQLFDGALSLANKGFRVSGEWVHNTSDTEERFNPSGIKTFFGPKGAPYRPGDIITQPALAKFLKLYRDSGAKAFYSGKMAEDLVETVQEAKGVLSFDDMKKYKPRWLEPLTTNFAGYKLYLMPPPSSGGVIVAEAVRLIEKLNVKSYPEFSADEYQLLGEIEKLSYRGRSALGDPDFAKNPIEQLLNDKYLSWLAGLVKLDKTIDPEPLRELKFEPNKEKEQTTHFSVLDSQGNSVAMTVTLNGDYGSGLVTKNFGVALNNEMNDFMTQAGKPNMFGLIQGEPNAVRAGARPLSSMTPTIVEKDGRTVLSVGSPGGPRITTAVLQVLFRVLVRADDIDVAIQSPRVHHQFLPNILYVGRKRFAPEILASLHKRGQITQEGSTAKVFGVQLNSDGILSGAFDSRGEGAAGGY